MKILNASQLSELDQFTCREQQISSWELMERAAENAYQEIKGVLHSESKSIKIFAGPGNNGGDGLAVAYFLARDGYNVEVYLVNFTSSRSVDNQKNLTRLKNQSKVKLKELDEDSKLPDFDGQGFVIDSIFGVGLNRPMPDFVQKLIENLNDSNFKTIAIDVPSGLYMDQSPGEEEQVFQSDLILTFQTPKLAFYLPDYSDYIGEVKVIDIGLSQKKLESISSESTYIDLNLAKKIYKPRPKFSHKGTYGHALIVGGSHLMLGSVILSSSSCMRSGVGKTSVMMPNAGHHTLLQYLPEVMLVENPSEKQISFQAPDFTPQSIGIGIGIGKSEDAYGALKSWLDYASFPIVIDADALNLIAEYKELLDDIPKQSILTPHPGELKRLIGEWNDDFDKIKKIKTFSKQWDVVVLAKDAFSLSIYKDRMFVNSTGNSGLATAGSGDVLTGLLSGLLAQGYDSLDAAIFGAFIHGQAGDIAVINSSEESLIASDIVSYLGHSFAKIKD